MEVHINVGKTKYAFISRQQNAKQNRNIKVAKKRFQNVAKLKYLRMTLTNRNCMKKKIKIRLN